MRRLFLLLSASLAAAALLLVALTAAQAAQLDAGTLGTIATAPPDVVPAAPDAQVLVDGIRLHSAPLIVAGVLPLLAWLLLLLSPSVHWLHTPAAKGVIPAVNAALVAASGAIAAHGFQPEVLIPIIAALGLSVSAVVNATRVQPVATQVVAAPVERIGPPGASMMGLLLLLGLPLLGAGCAVQLRQAVATHAQADRDSAIIVHKATTRIRQDDCDRACCKAMADILDQQADAVSADAAKVK